MSECQNVYGKIFKGYQGQDQGNGDQGNQAWWWPGLVGVALLVMVYLFYLYCTVYHGGSSVHVYNTVMIVYWDY